MSLTSALNSATSGLAATSRRADVVAGNIANASTPGYVRRQLVVAETILSGQGRGVHLLGIDRAQDLNLSRERRVAEGAAVRADIVARANADLNRELGEPGDDVGLFSAYQKVETSLRELAVTPESTALQNGAYNSFNSLANQFSDLHSISQDQRLNADHAIARSVRGVNEALYQIQKINGQIARLSGQVEGTAALEDERQRQIDKISLLIPVKDIPRDGGQVDIVTNEGVFLLSGNVHELEFSPAGIIPSGTVYGDGSGILSGLKVRDQDITLGSGHFAISSGVIAGYFTVRDQIAPEFQSRIDALAADVMTRFSAAGVDTTLAAGAPGIFTDNGAAYDPANTNGLASRMRLNTAIDPAQGGSVSRIRDGLGSEAAGPLGNAEILNNLLTAFTQSNVAPAGSGLLGAHTSSELAAGLSSLVGEAKVNADALAASSRTRANTLSDAELSQTAVDTDAEMQTLLLVEQAYSANARVIKAVSEMLDVLMSL